MNSFQFSVKDKLKLKTIHAGLEKPLERRAGKSVKEVREGEFR
jgi:hypothetical protein